MNTGNEGMLLSADFWNLTRCPLDVCLEREAGKWWGGATCVLILPTDGDSQ